jgi:phosphoglucomutase
MPLHPLAGRPAPRESLVDVRALVAAYHDRKPDPGDPAQRVSFGTSGHRGSSLHGAFNEAHVLAITQAVCEVRRSRGVTGPLFLGRDTHALSGPAADTALEVLAANGVEIVIQAGGRFTPTPVISHAILTHNRGRDGGLADGIVVTPSHNPPADGGFKYNPPSGGPAEAALTDAIQSRANDLLDTGLAGVRRLPLASARNAPTTREADTIDAYVRDLESVLDLEAVARSGLRLGVDPLGGASIECWDRIASVYGLDLEVVNRAVDPAFGFMPLDHDGKIRMDCSSRHAMSGLIAIRDRFDVAFGADPDSDRHGIVTRSGGLLDPNHFLSAAIDYLFRHRPGWRAGSVVGKTLVSSSMIDRVAAALGRTVREVPVGFKWFVDGLLDGSFGFAGEESAGASFLRRDGTVWTTDKDGILLGLLAAEMTAVTGRDPAQAYEALGGIHGRPAYRRLDAPADEWQRAALKRLSPDRISATSLAGDPIRRTLSHAPGNGAAIGGIKVESDQAWFAARPSGTEDVYKIYAESFRGEDHLARVQEEARSIVDAAFSGG